MRTVLGNLIFISCDTVKLPCHIHGPYTKSQTHKDALSLPLISLPKHHLDEVHDWNSSN